MPPRSRSRTRVWRRTRLALWSAQRAAVVEAEGPSVRSGSQVAVAHWRNNQVPNQSIGARQCLRDTAAVRAVGDIQFCSDFLTRQLDQAVATLWLTTWWLT